MVVYNVHCSAIQTIGEDWSSHMIKAGSYYC